MVSVFFGNVTDPSGIDLTIYGLIGGIIASGIIAVWQSTENKRSQGRLIQMARHYELRTALINLGKIFCGGDERMPQNEDKREIYVKELTRYQDQVEKLPEVTSILTEIKKHPAFSGTGLHHCKECHKISTPIGDLVNNTKFQNPNHQYNTMKFEVSYS